MALTEVYCDPDLSTGLNDGTSEANAWRTLAAAITGQAAGERLNIKKTASAHQPGAAVTFTVSSTATAPAEIRGYDSTIGDGVKFVLDMEGNRLSNDGDYVKWSTFDITGNNATAVMDADGDGTQLYDIKIVNTSTTSSSQARAVNLVDAEAAYCHFETTGTDSGQGSAGSHAVRISRGSIRDSHVKSTRTGIHFDTANREGSIINVTIEGSGASTVDGIHISGLDSGQASVKNVSIDNFGDGIHLPNVPAVTDINVLTISGCVINDCTNGILNADGATHAFGVLTYNNAMSNITTAKYSGFGNATSGRDDVTDMTDDPFNADMSLNNDTNGGAKARAAGIFGAGVVTQFQDLGALQHQDAGGGGGLLVHPGMTGGINA